MIGLRVRVGRDNEFSDSMLSHRPERPRDTVMGLASFITATGKRWIRRTIGLWPRWNFATAS